MNRHTGIEWTDITWNPSRGCSRVSQGCKNCYAERVASQFCEPRQPYHGLVQFESGQPRWTGKVRVVDSLFFEPFKWGKAQRVFVNSMSDLFHAEISDADIDRIFAVMALCDRHDFQILTKRARRMRDYTRPELRRKLTYLTENLQARVAANALRIAKERGEQIGAYWDMWLEDWPLRNIWLGASAENQSNYDFRRPDLETTDARVIWWSLEPLIGPIRLRLGEGQRVPDWVVVGGETGPGARPMHPQWVRMIRDECKEAGVPFFFKQWGEWAPGPYQNAPQTILKFDGTTKAVGGGELGSGNELMSRITKLRAGRILDGKTHGAMPKEYRVKKQAVESEAR